MPSGTNLFCPYLDKNDDGSLSLEYTPRTSGSYDISLSYDESPLEGYPLKVYVDSSDSKQAISVYGPGLIKGVRGQTLKFYIICGKAIDEIQVNIEGPRGVVNVERYTDSKGQIVCSYQAVVAGEYFIHIARKKQSIYGSPYLAKISGDGRKKSVIQIPNFGDFSMGGAVVGDGNLGNLSSQIKSPDGMARKKSLTRMENKKLGISTFQPKRKGVYTVKVMQENDKAANDDPLSYDISELELCSPSRVKVTGCTSQAVSNEWNEMQLNLTDAGFGALSISVEGSHTFDLESKTKGHGEDVIILYRPHEPGIYVMHVKYGYDHVAGSPFMLSVTGEPSGRKRTIATFDLIDKPPPKIGENCSLEINLPGVNPLDITATLSTPSGQVDLCEIRDREGSLFEVRFSSTETGPNVISLKQKGIHMTGSPFIYTIGEETSGGSHRVEIFGMGVEHGIVSSKNFFNIYTHECGPGKISVGMDGPSEAEIDLHDTGMGFISASYMVKEPGEYNIGVMFNDTHIPTSPNRVHVPPECKAAKLVTLHGLKDEGLEPDKPVLFSVNNSGANGEFTGHVITPSGAKQELILQEIDNEESSCRFLPRENGVYKVYLMFNGVYVPGCPFAMLVGKLGPDTALVRITGNGLSKGIIGKPSKFLIHTVHAGVGILTVDIEGPDKVGMICNETEAGHEFTYTPQTGGNYLIYVKFGHASVPGCPFKAFVVGGDPISEEIESETSRLSVETLEKKPKMKSWYGDAGKVVVAGNGILPKTIINRSNNFTIDVKEAGQSLLSVSMVSSNGNPVKELSCKKTKPNIYTVAYTPDEKGEHLMYVQWGEYDVKGSPFSIIVA